MKYSIHKTIGGKLRVKHQCPHCSEALENELAEAGHPDKCPACGTAIVVPGTAEREKFEADLARAAAQRKQQQEQVQKEAEARKLKARETAVLPPRPEFKQLPAFDPPQRELPQRPIDIPRIDYPALEIYRQLFRCAGYLCLLAFAAMVVLVVVLALKTERELSGAFSGIFVAGVISLPLALTCFVTAEVIKLAVDARRDLGRLVKLFESQSSKE